MTKTNKYFSEIMDGMHDALEHEKGTKKLRTKSVTKKEFGGLLTEARNQAKTVKMKKSDIVAVVKKVRQKSR